MVNQFTGYQEKMPELMPRNETFAQLLKEQAKNIQL